jgi:hypothetical protein
MNDNTLNNVTNQLLLKYDKNFQKYYQASDVLNQGIMNKEELILKNLQEDERKNKMIRILNVTIAFVILAFFLFSAHALQKIQNKQLWIGLTLLFLFYLFYIYFKILYESKINLALLSYQTGQSMKAFGEGILAGSVPNYQCPTGCELSGNDEISGSSSNNFPDDLNYPAIPILDRQSSQNVWLDGNQPWFRKINPKGATYYQCEYDGPLGSGYERGIPMIGKEKVFSTIPCTEMKNYKQLGRYICMADTALTELDATKCTSV